MRTEIIILISIILLIGGFMELLWYGDLFAVAGMWITSVVIGVQALYVEGVK